MHLFKTGKFKLSSGKVSDWKIECDALVSQDWDTLAGIVSKRFKFNRVVGIPEGGLPFAEALEPYAKKGSRLQPTLLVDDVMTTGRSFEEHRHILYNDEDVMWVMCIAAFSRTAQEVFGDEYDKFPIYSLFQINPLFLSKEYQCFIH